MKTQCECRVGTPNAMSLEALSELQSGGGTVHSGSAQELFDAIGLDATDQPETNAAT